MQNSIYVPDTEHTISSQFLTFLFFIFVFPGFEGKNCEINKNECLESGCQDNEPGVKYCVDRINDYQCVCQDGFTGKNCQDNIGRDQLIFSH